MPGSYRDLRNFIAQSLTLAPADGGASSKPFVLGCSPGAGCSAAMGGVLVCAFMVASRNSEPRLHVSAYSLPIGERQVRASLAS